MDILRIILVVLHLIGLASLLGGFMVQIKDIIAGKGRVVAAMVHGALTQLVTGLALVGVAEMARSMAETAGDPLNHTKIAVKLVIAVLITVLVFVYRKKQAPAWVLWSIGALTVANVVVAVAWH